MMKTMSVHTYGAVRAELGKRLKEPAPGRVQLLSGPRQVGKTTLLLEIAKEFGESALYIAADAPEAALAGWWEIQWQRAEAMAARRKTILLIDEIHHVSAWPKLLKSRMDQIYRKKAPLHVVVTGSSALHLGAGSRETMAGRFERLSILHWPVSEVARRLRIKENRALMNGMTLGAYPGAVRFWRNPARWRAYIRDSIIEPAIGKDVLMMESIRKPALLRQIFAVAAGHPAEIVSLQKIAGRLNERSALETVAHYLHVLEEACLVAGVQKYSHKAIRRRMAPPKLIALSQAFLSASGPDEPPSPKKDPAQWGRYVENACLSHAWNCGQQVYYWREEPLEVDGVFIGSWGKWAVEVKTGPHTYRDLRGLTEFCRRYPEFRPLVICDADHVSAAAQMNVKCLTWKEFLLTGC